MCMRSVFSTPAAGLTQLSQHRAGGRQGIVKRISGRPGRKIAKESVGGNFFRNTTLWAQEHQLQ